MPQAASGLPEIPHEFIEKSPVLMVREWYAFRCECGRVFCPAEEFDPLLQLMAFTQPCPDCGSTADLLKPKAYLLDLVDKMSQRIGLDLSRSQELAVFKILGAIWLHATGKKETGQSRLSLTGHAGTGKTTVIRLIADVCRSMGLTSLYAAPTGKAAARLRDKLGRPVMTVHSLLYGAPEEVGICPSCGKDSGELACVPEALVQKNVHAYTCPACEEVYPLDHEFEIELNFTRRDVATGRYMPQVIFVDEASMVSEEMLRDMMAHLLHTPRGSLFVFVGDPGQLPPVKEDVSLALEPVTAHLSDVHRQAKGSAILYAAYEARCGRGRNLLSYESRGEANFDVVNYASMDWVTSWARDMLVQGLDATLVCYTNKTRTRLNDEIRSKYMRATGSEEELYESVLEDDLLVCLRNNKKADVMNGEVLKVETAVYHPYDSTVMEVTFRGRPGSFFILPEFIKKDYRTFKFATRALVRRFMRAVNEFEQSDRLRHQYHSLDDFLEARKIVNMIRMLHVGYGYALTVHRAQGSEWDHVGYIWERATWGMAYNDPKEFAKHLYTGITRGSKHVTLMVMKKGET